MSTPYSRRPEWVAAARAFLISVRDRSEEDLPRYGEVAQQYGGIARAVAPVLNTVARDCAKAGEPDLSALVVLSDTGLPGRLNGQVVDPGDPSVHSAWHLELARIRAHEWPDGQEARQATQDGLPTPQPDAPGRLARALDQALGVPRPVVLAHLERLAAKYPDDATALHKALGREFLAAVTTAGAAAGGAAAAPGIGTALAAAANVGVMVGFFGAAALYVLALAELHGLRVDDVERRRTLLLAVLLGDSGAQVVRQAAERTGRHWGRWAAANASRETIRAINRALGRNFVTVYGTKQGILVIGRAAPFGIGAVIGGGGNLILGRGIIAAAGRAFGPPPSEVGAWRPAAQAAPDADVILDAEVIEPGEDTPPALA